MIPIRKKTPPNSLSQYRNTTNASFDNLPSASKEELRQSLRIEQKGICCYCMSRIVSERSRVEHWHSQKEFPEEQLDYDNMMLACHGNEGQSPKEQHCDVKKKDLRLKFNPSNPDHAGQLKIHYSKDGTMRSEDTEFNDQLKNVLNLNISVLKRNRAAVHDSLVKVLDKKGWTLGSIEKLTQKYRPGYRQEAEPFCGCVLYHLEKYGRKHS